MTSSHSSGDMLISMRSRRMPALLTNTSSPPKVSSAVSIRWRAPSQSDTSSALTTASAPIRRIVSTTSLAGPIELPDPSTLDPRSLTTTRAPCRASSKACSRPRPRPAPVTIATRPSQIPVIARLPPPRTRFFRQPERALADDVPLDLTGPGVDGPRAAGQKDVLPLPGLVVGSLGADHRRRADHSDRNLAESLVELAPKQLVDRGLRAWFPALRHAGEQAQTGKAHDLDLRVRPGKLLAYQRVSGLAVAACQIDQLPHLLLEAEMGGRRVATALEPQRRHRRRPTVVEPA